MQTAVIEVNVTGKQWEAIGELRVHESNIDRGYRAPAFFSYDLNYLDRYSDHISSNGYFAASLRLPLNYGTIESPQAWPSFVLDILPSGAARQSWLKRLEIQDGPSADWQLLTAGAINPPGHLRIKNKLNLFSSDGSQQGFSYSDVVQRGMDFIAYAENMGALVSGGTGAQGVAPKFLLTQDPQGRWHADGALSDSDAREWWIVKFPRGKKRPDYLILELEAIYYKIAQQLNVKTYGPLKIDNDNLFIKRFDRLAGNAGQVMRLGLESLTSAAGISDFGKSLRHEEYLKCIAQFSSSPQKDIFEYVFRDFLNIVCGNTDNHGRNTAFLKHPNGRVELSPLFDFAPMVLDDSGIARATRWSVEESYLPDFKSIFDEIEKYKIPNTDIKDFFVSSKERLAQLPSLFQSEGIRATEASKVCVKYDEFMQRLDGFTRTL